MAHPQMSVLESARRWLAAGERVWLCTILETWGSSPRPAGSMLAVSGDGHWAGSVSGGCLEEDLLQRTARGDQPDTPVIVDYGISAGDQERFRLPCGGRIQLLVEPLSARHLDGMQQLLQALADNRAVCRIVALDTGAVSIELDVPAPTGIRQEEGRVHQVLGPECRLLLVGAGDVSAHVAAFGHRCGFAVTLCEPREAFLRGWWEAETPAVATLPDDLVMESFSDRYNAVLALAHDPRVDDMALLAALNSECFYVGAMGSKQTSRARRERLLSLGVTDEQLARLHAPVGVAIRSKTPAEIAVSIIADLVDARHDLLAGSGAL
ncbi:XdhC family protein [Marinobacter halodurans]|uniref:XdhC family protein n=1 Tax=Marinobacter halodurans TaxID=2528979 RepID=A0ABY1ZMN0_9GAMM|nr:XdhC family protein [Marinobacter halodurans]TBW54442.1 XdhC family protein [Marinobacter halodurans]